MCGSDTMDWDLCLGFESEKIYWNEKMEYWENRKNDVGVSL